jgi:transcriptional regulator with XRE-family HTH domain
MDLFVSEFSQKLKDFRERQRKFKNSTEFYKALGASQPTGSRYESGETQPDLSFLNNLLKEFPEEALHLMPGWGMGTPAVAEPTPTYVTDELPSHVQAAYELLCEILDLKKATPADGDRKLVGGILGKAAKALASGMPLEVVRKDLTTDAELFLRILR